MFIAALFVLAPNWEQSRCPTTCKWIKKLSYTYTMEYYSAANRNSLVIHEYISNDPVEWKPGQKKKKKAAEEEYMLCDLVYTISQKWKVIYSNRKQIRGCLEWGAWEGWIAKGHEDMISLICGI